MRTRVQLAQFAQRILSLGVLLVVSDIAQAQIIPDGSLNTTVIPNGDRFTILNGTSAGNNLFHSFQQFSVPTGGAVPLI
uniref:Uncharacterized protein n=1 Tax=Desertifilum tharense IPPAS B-1220 TaxID=1781255 RepID=A0ACD5GN60_9CYAN